MKTQLLRALAILLGAILFVPPAPLWATCGGGGGGGTGGVSAGGGAPDVPEPTYRVPWRLQKPSDPPVKEGLVLYWFPTGQKELDKSSLRSSRQLTLYAAQCVTLEVADAAGPLGQKLVPGEKLPVAVLAEPDNTVLGKAENKDGFLKVDQVERLVESEVKKRDSATKERLESAKNRAKAGDKQGAIEELQQVMAQKCMFPSRAKDAAKELKKLGVNEAAQLFESPNFDARVSARMVRTMDEGLAAENSGHYMEAERLYTEARRMDPADPTPLRFLGELYRHHIGEWDKARSTFEEILAMPADPLARAVALHGLGKMTIHEGDFKQGLAMMERSVETFPLALAYRNLAVYWNSEGDAAKTNYYVSQALAVAPKDPYNLVFAAAFMAQNGRGEEALKIAKENEGLLPASYNLAAIFAQMGERQKALELLKRHFYQYERYEAVRSKEMMEARVDAVFASLKSDPAFVALTAGADGKLDPAKTMSERH
jgi:tetratricopeptide (TPR) repeat protein